MKTIAEIELNFVRSANNTFESEKCHSTLRQVVSFLKPQSLSLEDPEVLRKLNWISFEHTHKMTFSSWMTTPLPSLFALNVNVDFLPSKFFKFIRRNVRVSLQRNRIFCLASSVRNSFPFTVLRNIKFIAV